MKYNEHIKHRMWDARCKYMNYKVLVGNIDSEEDANWTAHAMWVEPDKVDYKCEPHWTNVDSVSNIPLMRFTGYQDVNNKEIYESDIIVGFDGKNKGIIKFGQHQPALCFSHHGFYIFDITDNVEKRFDFKEDSPWNQPKVIGNIYENLELL